MKRKRAFTLIFSSLGLFIFIAIGLLRFNWFCQLHSCDFREEREVRSSLLSPDESQLAVAEHTRALAKHGWLGEAIQPLLFITFFIPIPLPHVLPPGYQHEGSEDYILEKFRWDVSIIDFRSNRQRTVFWTRFDMEGEPYEALKILSWKEDFLLLGARLPETTSGDGNAVSLAGCFDPEYEHCELRGAPVKILKLSLSKKTVEEAPSQEATELIERTTSARSRRQGTEIRENRVTLLSKGTEREIYSP